MGLSAAKEMSAPVAAYDCGADGCPLEGGGETVPDIGFTFRRCPRCRVLRLPHENLVDRRVPPDPVGELSPAMKILFRMRCHWLNRQINKLRKKDLPILDMGCGDGQFLAYLKDAGYSDLTGIEPEAGRAANARLRGLKVLEGLDALDGGGQFSIIFLWHVMEHVPAPVTLLRRLIEHLERNGALIVSVPNHASAQTRLFGRWSTYPDYGRHLWFHSPGYEDFLAECMAECDIRVIANFNFEYEIFGWVDTWASFIFGRRHYVHGTLKKGTGPLSRRFAALAAAIVLLPFAVSAAAVSLAVGRGSTLNLKLCLKTS